MTVYDSAENYQLISFQAPTTQQLDPFEIIDKSKMVVSQNQLLIASYR